MATSKPAGWHWDDDWRHEKLMDWLLTPPSKREPSTRNELATVLGVDQRTMRGWADHPQFREEWQRRVSKLIGSPERHQQVLDNLYRAAIDPKNRNQVQAAKLYLEATDAIKPKPMQVTVKKATELSDEELDEMLARGAAEMRSERETAGDNDVV